MARKKKLSMDKIIEILLEKILEKHLDEVSKKPKKRSKKTNRKPVKQYARSGVYKGGIRETTVKSVDNALVTSLVKELTNKSTDSIDKQIKMLENQIKSQYTDKMLTNQQLMMLEHKVGNISNTQPELGVQQIDNIEYEDALEEQQTRINTLEQRLQTTEDLGEDEREKTSR